MRFKAGLMSPSLISPFAAWRPMFCSMVEIAFSTVCFFKSLSATE